MAMEINWIKPERQIPPFGQQILVVLGGTGSDNAGGSWNSYVKVANVVISKRSPNDVEEQDQYDEFMAGNGDDFDQFQFYVYDYADYKYGMGDDEAADWFSDSIVCWAPMPAIEQFKE